MTKPEITPLVYTDRDGNLTIDKKAVKEFAEQYPKSEGDVSPLNTLICNLLTGDYIPL